MLLEKQIKKIFIKQNITQNIFLLPFIMAFLQFCFLFVALFGSGYFFELKVLFVSGGLIVLWGVFFICSWKNNNCTISWKSLLLILLFCCFCLVIIRHIWFFSYLRVDALKTFFEGKTHIDTIYHSVHAESIITHGYPSLLLNSDSFHAYHCFSHYLIAWLSIILGLPCLITYNYIYPIVFFPLFFYLFQKTVLIGKLFFSKNDSLWLIDYLLIMCVIYGFFRVSVQKKIGYYLYSDICNSETVLISLVILFIYFVTINIGFKKIRNFENINCYVAIPLAIIVLSYTKLPVGFIFLLGASYYTFRKYLFINIKAFCFCEYFFLWFLFNYILYSFSSSYSGTIQPEETGLTFFYYVKKYCFHGQVKWALSHYSFLLLPSILIIIFSRKKIFVKDFISNRKTIFQEMCFFLIIASFLPGIFYKINSDSSFGFIIPVYFLSWILFLSYNLPQKLYCYYIYICKNNIIVFKSPIVLLILILFFSSFVINDLKLSSSVVVTMRSRISLVGFRQDILGKLKELFLPVNILQDENYNILNQSRALLVKRDIKEYCVFLSPEFDIISRYDLSKHKPPNIAYFMRPYWAVSGYLGIPVMNGIYEDNGLFYRGDGKLLGTYNDFPGYGLPPALCDKKITKENMIERAKFLNKKHIIVINKHSYEIVDVE